MYNRSHILCAAGLLLLALAAGSLGTFLLFILPPIVRNQIEQVCPSFLSLHCTLNILVQQTHLGFNATGAYTDTTQKWIAPEYDLSLNIWTFSVKNPDAVTVGATPNLTEKGPYSFK
jgi:hypothetical protein